MQGRLATSLRYDDGHPAAPREHVVAEISLHASVAQRDHRRMLEQQHDPLQQPVGHRGTQPPLQVLEGEIRREAEIEYRDGHAGLRRQRGS